MVCYAGTQCARRARKGENQARRVVHLTILEYGRPGESLNCDVREQLKGLAPAEETCSAYTASRILHVPVDVSAQRVIDKHPRPEEPTAALAAPVGRNDKGQGSNQVRGNAQKYRTLKARGAQTPDVGMLEVADATVHHFEAMGRCSR